MKKIEKKNVYIKKKDLDGKYVEWRQLKNIVITLLFLALNSFTGYLTFSRKTIDSSTSELLLTYNDGVYFGILFMIVLIMSIVALIGLTWCYDEE